MDVRHTGACSYVFVTSAQDISSQMNEEKEWTGIAVISFINDLEILPMLWDSKSPHYKMGRAKNDIWLQLAKKYNFTSDEMKRKWQSLQAQYRREKMRELTSGGNYKSRWFAFDHLNFLGDRYRPKKIIGTPETFEVYGAKDEVRSEEEEEHQFVGEEDPGVDVTEEIEDVPVTATAPVTVTAPVTEDMEEVQSHIEHLSECRTFTPRASHPFKRMKYHPYEGSVVQHQPPINAPFKRPAFHEQLQKRNEYTVFGEYVAMKLRKMDDRLCAIVQHEIHNILFQAEMGQLGDYSLSTQGSFVNPELDSSSHSVHSPSSTSHNHSVYEIHRSH